MAILTKRITPPTKDNSYYWSNNNPYTREGNYMPNCTCYAWGRYWESGGDTSVLPLGNAGQWYPNCSSQYKGTEPKVGAILCWSKPGGAGHVAFVEEVRSDGTIVTTDSQYTRETSNINDSRYWRQKVRSNDGNWSGGDYTFQGFIYNTVEFEGSSGGSSSGGDTTRSISLVVTFNEGIELVQVFSTFDSDDGWIGALTDSGTIELPSVIDYRVVIWADDTHYLSGLRVFDWYHFNESGTYTKYKIDEEGKVKGECRVKPIGIYKHTAYLDLYAETLRDSTIEWDVSGNKGTIHIHNYLSGYEENKYECYIYTDCVNDNCTLLGYRGYNAYSGDYEDSEIFLGYASNNSPALNLISFSTPNFSNENCSLCNLNFNFKHKIETSWHYRYALCSSDENFNMYKNHNNSVNENTQICTGILSFNSSNNINISNTNLEGNQTYYLYIWPYDSSYENSYWNQIQEIHITYSSNNGEMTYTKYVPYIYDGEKWVYV